jgi:nickel/cobalt transporter (NicO) family protein
LAAPEREAARAVGVHRTALGLAMFVAFSAGLAVVLVGLGLVLVTARLGHRVRRVGGGSAPLGRLIPLGSAVVVAVLGLARG